MKAYNQPSVRSQTRDEDPLIGELVASGILSEAAVGWARAHGFESGVPLDTALLEHSCFFEGRGAELRTVTVQDGRLGYGQPFAVLETDCPLGAALRYGGYFAGPVARTPADRRLFGALGRPLPRWGMAVPVPADGDRRLVFYADNGPRGIATSWIAKITLLTSRLGRLGASGPGESSTSFEEAFEKLVDSSAEPEGDRPPPDPWTPGERDVMIRLRHAAAGAGLTVEELVDRLMREKGVRPPPEDGGDAEDAAALVGEIKALFEKLASDIPAQLARGMETAFCKMAPRLAAVSPAVPKSAAAAGVGLVRKETAEREVPSYRSRRRKTRRVKL
jgi:hypothetical protein